MPNRFFMSTIAAILALAGCQHGSPASPNAPAATATPEANAAIALPANEHLMGVFDLQFALDLGSASITPRRSTTAQPPQALSYDLDIAKFLSGATLSVASIAQTTSEVVLTISHKHPFAAPDFTLPITGKNRADLSYTGRLLILADQNVQTVNVPGEGAYKFDPGWIANPDGYLAVGDLLAKEGLTSNVFPYRLLVDEAADNRIGISNEDVMIGNYDAASGGWQRGNAGAGGDAWTGYDYLHAGQAVELTLRLKKSDLTAGPLSMPLAIMIKYTDPRGEVGPFARFPFEPTDVARFAYRLPYAALDASACDWCDQLDVAGLPNVAQVSVRVRDWDTGAATGADENLSDEADVSLIQPGADEAPIVEVVAPALSATPITLPLVGGTGLPGDELAYSGPITNVNGVDGAGWMLIRARDPEGTDPAFDSYHFGVDPDTIIPDATRALPPQTFMPLYIRAWPSSSVVREFSAGQFQSSTSMSPTPQGTFLLAGNYPGPLNDQNPAACDQPAPHAGSYDAALTEIDESGNLVRQWVWADPCYNAIWDGEADADGNIYIAFSFESETYNWSPRTMDFDPGSGVDLHTSVQSSLGIIKLDPDGNYLWGGQLDDAKYTGTGWLPGISASGIAVSDTGDIAISGTVFEEIDLDPGPGVTLINSGAWSDWYLTVLDNDGSFLWGLTDTGGEYEYCSAPIWKQNGNVALTGSYSDVMDVDPGPGTTELPQPDRTAGFRAEWSRSGAVVQAVPWSHDDDGGGEGLALIEDPTGGEYVIGSFSKVTDLDLTGGVDVYNESAYRRIFISHYSSAGAYEWSAILHSDTDDSSSSTLYGAGVQPDGTLILGLDAYGFGLDMDPGPGTVWLGEEGGPWYGWAAYDTDGEFQWLRELPRAASVFLSGLQVATNGRPVLRWNGIGSQDIDPGPGAINLTLPVYGYGFTYLQPDGSW